MRFINYVSPHFLFVHAFKLHVRKCIKAKQFVNRVAKHGWMCPKRLLTKNYIWCVFINKLCKQSLNIFCRQTFSQIEWNSIREKGSFWNAYKLHMFFTSIAHITCNWFQPLYWLFCYCANWLLNVHTSAIAPFFFAKKAFELPTHRQSIYLNCPIFMLIFSKTLLTPCIHSITYLTRCITSLYLW